MGSVSCVPFLRLRGLEAISGVSVRLPAVAYMEYVWIGGLLGLAMHQRAGGGELFLSIM